MKALEQELGVQLLNRSTHSVVPTEAGLRLLENERLPAALRRPDSRSGARGLRRARRLQVSIGLLPAVAYIVTPPLLTRLRKEMPRISVMVSEGLGIFLRERLLLGQVDLAVMTAGRVMKD